MRVARLTLQWFVSGFALGLVAALVVGVLWYASGRSPFDPHDGRDVLHAIRLTLSFCALKFVIWMVVLGAPLALAIALWVWCAPRWPRLEHPLNVVLGTLAVAISLAATLPFVLPLHVGPWDPRAMIVPFFSVWASLLLPRLLLRSLRPGALVGGQADAG